MRRILAATAVLIATASFVTWLAPSVAADSPTIRYVATNGDDNYGGSDANPCTDKNHPCATISQAANYDLEWGTGQQTVVKVAPGTYTQNSGPGSLWLCESVEIDGGVDFNNTGAGPSVVQGVSGDAAIRIPGGECPVPDSGPTGPPVVVLDNLDITGSGTDPGVQVGFGGSVTIDNSTVTNGEPGVFVDYGGGSATIEDSTLSDNVNIGAFVSSYNDSLTLLRSTVSGTSYDSSWGLPPGGVVVATGSASIDSSTISGNAGRGVAAGLGTVQLLDSTIADTKSSADSTNGGIVVDAGLAPSVRRATNHRTGQAPSGLKPLVKAPAITVTGSIVGSQAAGVPDCSAPSVDINDQGYNLSSDHTCGFTGTGDVIGNPQLGGLADNGGPTETMMLGAGSPARDAIPDKSGTCTDEHQTDQRGVGRPINGACDIGAVEAAVAAPPPPSCPALVVVTQSLPDGTVGQQYSQQLQAAGGCDDVYHWTLYSGSLPEGLTLSDSGLISGVPTESGDFTFVVSVNDPAFGTLVIHVNPAPVTTTPTTAPPTTAPPSTSAPAPSSSSLGVEPISASAGPSQSAPALANTGVTVGSQLRFAWLLLAAGVAMLLAGRMTRRAGRRH